MAGGTVDQFRVSPKRIVIELDPAHLATGNLVLAAALSLFYTGYEIAVCLTGVVQPTLEQAEALRRVCLEYAAGAPLPDIVLLGQAEAADQPAEVTVVAAADPREAVAAIVMLSSVAMRDWRLDEDDAHRAAADFLAQRDVVITDRDTMTSPTVTPMIAVVVQVQSTWGTVEGLCRVLADRDDVRLEVVAVDSEHDIRQQSTAAFLRAQGYRPRDVGWLEKNLAQPSRGLCAVVFADPWDGLRPWAATATAAAEYGVRVVYLPYSPNAAAGERMAAMSYDLQMHRVAWRVYVRSETQRDMFAQHCSVGAGQVRVAGAPKFDRVLTAPPLDPDSPLVQAARGRRVVLWNPHFSIEPGGWSTFPRFVEPLLDYVATHDDLLLVVRPHFRLLRDLPQLGGPAAEQLRLLEEMAETHSNIAMDRSVDHLESFHLADAMMSDLSSLVTEFFVLDKPLLYLHRPDGPGINTDAEYFLSAEVATDWTGMQLFLEQLRRGEDPGRVRRELARRRHFGMVDGRAAQRIADDILDSVVLERLAAVQARSACRS